MDCKNANLGIVWAVHFSSSEVPFEDDDVDFRSVSLLPVPVMDRTSVENDCACVFASNGCLGDFKHAKLGQVAAGGNLGAISVILLKLWAPC